MSKSLDLMICENFNRFADLSGKITASLHENHFWAFKKDERVTEMVGAVQEILDAIKTQFSNHNEEDTNYNQDDKIEFLKLRAALDKYISAVNSDDKYPDKAHDKAILAWHRTHEYFREWHPGHRRTSIKDSQKIAIYTPGY